MSSSLGLGRHGNCRATPGCRPGRLEVEFMQLSRTTEARCRIRVYTCFCKARQNSVELSAEERSQINVRDQK